MPPAPPPQPTSLLLRQIVPSISPTNPLMTLVFSMPLAQSIQNLLLTSRQICAIDTQQAPGFFGQSMEQLLERKELYDRYEALRQAIEKELENAWISAGLLAPPPLLPALALPSQDFEFKSVEPFTQPDAQRNSDVFLSTPSPSPSPSPQYNDSLKRKQTDEDSKIPNRPKPKKRKRKNPPKGNTNANTNYLEDEHDESKEWDFWGVALQPLFSTAEIPLTKNEKRRLSNWNWRDVRHGRRDGRQGDVSPMSAIGGA